MLNSLLHQRLGRYSITALLGRGGMAAVYRARDAALQRDVALKVLYPQYTGEHTLVERFKREAVTAASLEHPNIVQVYDVGEQDDLLYIAMKLLSGYSLYDVLQARGALSVVELLPLLEQVASALDYAHRRGVIHRDIKPGNIILEVPRPSAPVATATAVAAGRDDATVQGALPAGSQPPQQIGALPAGTVAILTDFGIAKSLDTPGLTNTGALLGTPDYMAPEQIGGGRVDARTDVYALGVLVYRTLTGQRPFGGATQDVLLAHIHTMPDDPSLVNPHVPPALDPVMLRALSKQPDARYNSAGEFVQALRAAWHGRSAPAITAVPIGEQTTRVAQPRPTSMPVPLTQARTTMPAPVQAMPQRRQSNTLLFIALFAALLLVVGGVMASNATRLFGGSGGVAIASPATATSEGGGIGVVPNATSTASPEPPTQVPALPSATGVESSSTASTTSTEEATAMPSATSVPAPSPTPRVVKQTVIVVQPPPTLRPTSVPPPPPATITASPSPVPPTDTVAPPTDTVAPPTATVPPPTETATPAPVGCDESPLREGSGFKVLYENDSGVRGKIGCPANPGGEKAIQAVDQIFEHGTMYWWKSQDTVYVMPEGESPSGKYRSFNTTEVADLPDPPADIDPKMRSEGGFARVYYGVSEIREAIGAPVTAEHPMSGAYQAFEHGFMIYSPANGSVRGKTIYVLYNDGTFRRYDDRNPN